MSKSTPLFSWLALAVAALGTTGSLYLSLGLDRIACPLCFYQRAFMMASLGVLAIGLLSGSVSGSRLSLLALAPAIGGLTVASWHVFQVASGKMECPLGITDSLTAPHESLIVFALLTALLGVDTFRNCCAVPEEGKKAALAGVVAIILGVLFGYACIQGVHKVALPEELKSGELKICRPPSK